MTATIPSPRRWSPRAAAWRCPRIADLTTLRSLTWPAPGSRRARATRPPCFTPSRGLLSRTGLSGSRSASVAERSRRVFVEHAAQPAHRTRVQLGDPGLADAELLTQLLELHPTEV